MPANLQQKLAKDGRRGIPESFIFAKFCPPAPHNTTQYISYEYNSRLSSCPIKSTVDSLMQDHIKLVPGEGIVMMMDDEVLSLSPNCHDADSLSCCKLNTIPETLIGSAKSSYATLSSSTCSLS